LVGTAYKVVRAVRPGHKLFEYSCIANTCASS
jgi:hypothetical protein